MSNEPVTIGTVSDTHAAHLLRSRLETEGITVFLEEETYLGLRSFGTRNVEARLRVPADEVEDAVRILREIEPDRPWGAQAPIPPVNALRMFAILLLVGVLLAAWAYLVHPQK